MGSTPVGGTRKIFFRVFDLRPLLHVFLNLQYIDGFFLFSKPDRTDLFNHLHEHTSWFDYVSSMEEDGTWGDHLILYAAANVYKSRIRVISSIDCDVSITPDHLAVDKTNPLVLGHIHEKHYVSLQPREGN